MFSTIIALVGHVSAAFIILLTPAPFGLITDDFGLYFEFLLIRKTSGAIISQLQHPMHRKSCLHQRKDLAVFRALLPYHIPHVFHLDVHVHYILPKIFFHTLSKK